MVIDLSQLPLPATPYVICPCSHTALAKAYGISRKLLYSRMLPFREELCHRKGYKYNLEQVCLIISKLGFPASPINPALQS